MITCSTCTHLRAADWLYGYCGCADSPRYGLCVKAETTCEHAAMRDGALVVMPIRESLWKRDVNGKWVRTQAGNERQRKQCP